MADRIDHAAEASKHIDGVHDWQSDEGITDATLIASALIAQAEATLALVEQQRIANLIALATLSIDTTIPNDGHLELFDEAHVYSVDRLKPRYREALGIGEPA